MVETAPSYLQMELVNLQSNIAMKSTFDDNKFKNFYKNNTSSETNFKIREISNRCDSFFQS